VCYTSKRPGPPEARWATHGALLLVQLAFASQTVEAKVAMMPRAAGGEGIDPAALAMVRMLSGALVFQLVAHRRSAPRVPLGREVHARLFGLSLLGIALNQALFLFGLRWSTPFSVALLGAAIPIFTAALAVLLRKEPFAWATAAGLSLAAAGVVFLAGGPTPGALSGSLDIGVLLVTLNSLSYAAYVVLSRELVLRIGALRMMAWLFTYGALVFAPYGLVPLSAEVTRITPRGLAYLGYIVAVPTLLAYFLNAWALGRSRATIVTVYIVLQPLIAAVLARLQLGHAISPRAGVAGILIALGLALVMRRSSLRAAQSS